MEEKYKSDVRDINDVTADLVERTQQKEKLIKKKQETLDKMGVENEKMMDHNNNLERKLIDL